MNRSTLFVGVLISTILVGAALTDSYARRSTENAVAIAGTVSDLLRGHVRAGGHDVMITKHTHIYRVGKGMIDEGTLVKDAPVYIIGVARDGVVYAQFVIVSDSKKLVKGGSTRVLAPDEPL